ncbi:DUF6677 family protein [Chlamydiota bacterium]
MSKNKRSIIVGFFLAWLLPGMGHFYYGKRLKALIFFFSIITLYVVGILLGGDVLWYKLDFLTLSSFLVKYFCGLVFVITVILKPLYDNTAMYYEIGTAFILMAGTLNLLIIVDLYEVVTGKKVFRKGKEHTNG